MTEVPRRKLSELEFIYSRDPLRRDVYVEGPFDWSLMNWFIRDCRLDGVAVYPIESIDIPDGKILAAGRKANNRERVIFFSGFLADNRVTRASCIIDADFSRFADAQPVQPPLFETDYACMEMYFFNQETFNKFFILCCLRGNWPVQTIMDSLASVLQKVFLYRAADEELGWMMDWLDKNPCIDIRDWGIDFDSDEFVVRLLNKNARASKKVQFDSCVAKLRKRLTDEPRNQMHGHDFISLLSWYVRRKGVQAVRAHADNVLVCMTMALDYSTLRREPMFSSLLSRLTS